MHGNRRLEVLSSTPDWKATQREDGLFVVTRLGGDGMRGRFRSKESAERAAAKGNAETWLRLAVNAAPESINLPGHIAHYARMLAENAGMNGEAATKQCEEWAADEMRWFAIREAA